MRILSLHRAARPTPAGGLRRPARPWFACLWLALVCGTYGSAAHAYLDPGTGSILIQGLLAFVATVMTFFGTIRNYVRKWMTTHFSKPGNAAADDTTPDP